MTSSCVALTPFVPMKCPIKFDAVKPGWSIMYIEGSQVIIFLFLKIEFVLENRTVSNEMPPFAKVTI